MGRYWSELISRANKSSNGKDKSLLFQPLSIFFLLKQSKS
jgi:hypothetical protein